MKFMKRQKIEYLSNWKNSPTRKPLIVQGARQVGKTWLIKEFGNKYYEQIAYINFEKDKRLKSIFNDDFDIKRIIISLQVETGLIIKAENTLLVFDEIQAVPEAITCLKYFQEDAPEYHIIAAGSLLGVALHANISYPVGKVEHMNLFPLNFVEFLNAIGEEGLVTVLQTKDWKLITAYKSKFIERLRHYYFVGGMPEAVSKFCEDNDFMAVRKIQKQLLNTYDQDFSKHAPIGIVPRIRMVWNSIPAQLAKENKKFIYGLIKKGARAKEYELAISWLTDCGQVYKIYRVSKPGMPLKAYEDRGAFRLFMVDVGLLGAMVDIDTKTLLDGNAIFTEFKGALTEQYVMQQLKSMDEINTYYWSAENSTAEVDFVLQHKGKIVPVEVKAEENLQAKSLRVYNEKFNPGLSIRSSMSDFREQLWLTNLPLYAFSQITKLLE